MDSIMYLEVSTPCSKNGWNGCFKTHDSYRTEALVKDAELVDQLAEMAYKLVHKKSEWEYDYNTCIDLYYLETVGYRFSECHFLTIRWDSMHHTFEVLHWPEGSYAIRDSFGKLTKSMIKDQLTIAAENCWKVFPDRVEHV